MRTDRYQKRVGLWVWTLVLGITESELMMILPLDKWRLSRLSYRQNWRYTNTLHRLALCLGGHALRTCQTGGFRDPLDLDPSEC